MMPPSRSESKIPFLHSSRASHDDGDDNDDSNDEAWTSDDDNKQQQNNVKHFFGSSSKASKANNNHFIILMKKQKHKTYINLKNSTNKNRRRPAHIHRGVLRVLRFMICLFLMPLSLLTLYLPLYSPTQLRQDELTDWTFNTSRNVADYVMPQNDSTLLEPRDLCQNTEKFFLMIMVWSDLKNFTVRQTIRETWGNTTEFNYPMFAQLHQHLKGQYLEVNEERLQFYKEYLKYKKNETTTIATIQNTTIPVRIVFILGRSKQSNFDDEILEMRVRNESSNYQDILQENFIDTYNNLTLKSVLALKWVTRRCLQNCAYVLKCDDDTFINVPNLLHYLLGGTIPIYNYTIDLYDLRTSKALAAYNRLNKTQNYLAGYKFCWVPPIADVKSKWYMPYYMYAGSIYPNYLSGACYIMSIDIVPQLYAAALNTTLIYLEDVFITGLCAQNSHIIPVHHPLFEYFNPKMNRLKGIISQHHMSAKQLLKAYELVTDLTKRYAPPNRFYKHLPFRFFGKCV